MRVSANGGTPEVVVKTLSAMPQMLPDKKSILFTVSGEPNMIVVQNLETGARKELFPGMAAQYLPTGHIVYITSGNSKVLMAVSFDPIKLEVKGAHIPLFESTGMKSVSDSGTLAYIPWTVVEPASPDNSRILVWVDMMGNETPLNIQPDFYRLPRISPDKKKIAFTIQGDNMDIYTWIWFTKTETG